MFCKLIHKLLLLAALFTGLSAQGSGLLFDKLDVNDGLSDNNIRFINSLPDGRLVFTTEKAVNIYDGADFEKYPLIESGKYHLDRYDGHHHLYLSSDTVLLVKTHHSLYALDLRRGRFISPGDYLSAKGVNGKVDDLFVDSDGDIWVYVGDKFYRTDTNVALILPDGCGEIQDLETDGNCVYLFDNKGAVHCYDDLGGYRYSSSAYTAEEMCRYSNTSLVVKADNCFYQLRNGSHGVFLKFDPGNGVWQKILDRNYSLNTLMLADDHKAYITCGLGFWVVDVGNGNVDYLPFLRTRRGNVVATEISTVFQDAQGTLWVGTLNRGLLYCNPGRYKVATFNGVDLSGGHVRSSDGIFLEDRNGNVYIRNKNGLGKIMYFGPDSCAIEQLAPSLMPGKLMGEYGSDAAFISSDGNVYFSDAGTGKCTVFRNDEDFSPTPVNTPLLKGVYIFGERTEPGQEYDGRVLMADDEPYVREIVLQHDWNFITLEFSSLNYLPSCRIGYRYMLEGFDRDWVDVTPALSSELRAQYTNLPPGDYLFRVKSYSSAGDVESPVGELRIRILSPWYRTPLAYVTYVIVTIILLWLSSWVYIRYQRRVMERRHREEILLVRIKGLIEQCDRYQAELKSAEEVGKDQCGDVDVAGSEEENAFVAKAVKLVEDNINTPGYSVEQLSQDLCMERTGLYKKLVTLLNQSPSLFMRNIRLRRAAELLAAKEGSVAEIAERTGFGSPSYFSKCFQEVYGCRPSEYASKK